VPLPGLRHARSLAKQAQQQQQKEVLLPFANCKLQERLSESKPELGARDRTLFLLLLVYFELVDERGKESYKQVTGS